MLVSDNACKSSALLRCIDIDIVHVFSTKNTLTEVHCSYIISRGCYDVLFVTFL